jgi:tetratricopeptide (TPR) repeat protein
MKYALFLGYTVALVAFADVAVAKTPAEIKNIARSTTVEIKLQMSNTVGSGVIVHRQGNIYTLVTNRHVVCGSDRCETLPAAEKYSVGLADGQISRVDRSAIKLLGDDLDLAIIQFQSSHNYAVAQVAPANSLKAEDAVYTAGFPLEEPGFSFNAGKAIAVANKRINADRGGYSVIYDAYTLPGMSGGGVFDSNGQLVAIHGLGDRYTLGTEVIDDATLESFKDFFVNDKTGYNRGIPIRWIVQSLGEMGVLIGTRPPLSAIRGVPNKVITTADEYFIAGFNKYLDPGTDVLAGKRQAIQEFDNAIKLNPQYAVAYFARSSAKSQINDLKGSLADVNQALVLKPQFAEAYLSRASSKNSLNDFKGALADINQAIALNSKFSEAYLIRASIKSSMNDLSGVLADMDIALSFAPKYLSKRQYKVIIYLFRGAVKIRSNDLNGALVDINQSINLDPKNAIAYIFRGALKINQKDFNGALADFNQSIIINPQYSYAYTARGGLKADRLKDLTGAVADLNQAITIDPKNSLAYAFRCGVKIRLNDFDGALVDANRSITLDPTNALIYILRGGLRFKKEDFNGALADFNKSITIDPKNPIAYFYRSTIKLKQNNRAGAIQDLRQAAQLYRDQGQTQEATEIESSITKLNNP